MNEDFRNDGMNQQSDAEEAEKAKNADAEAESVADDTAENAEASDKSESAETETKAPYYPRSVPSVQDLTEPAFPEVRTWDPAWRSSGASADISDSALPLRRGAVPHISPGFRCPSYLPGSTGSELFSVAEATHSV